MKKNILLAAAIFSVLGTFAQVNSELESKSSLFADNTYLNVLSAVGFNVNTEFDFNYQGFGTSLQYGKWFTPTLGAQLNTSYLFSGDRSVNSLSVDFMMNASNMVNYREDRAFSVVPFVAVSGYFGKFGFADNYKFYPGVDLGVQLQYAFSQRVSLILEGRTSVSADLGDNSGSIPLANFSSVKLGVSYSFNPANNRALGGGSTPYSTALQAQEAQEAQVSESDKISELEAEIAQLKKELSAQKQKYEDLASQPSEVVDESYKVTPSPIFFSADATTPSEANIESLKYIAEIIAAHPDVVYIVEGYADSATGTASYNQTVSQRRADSVANALVKRYGVNRDQLKVVGKGGVDNLADKSHYNRCVIITAE